MAKLFANIISSVLEHDRLNVVAFMLSSGGRLTVLRTLNQTLNFIQWTLVYVKWKGGMPMHPSTALFE